MSSGVTDAGQYPKDPKYVAHVTSVEFINTAKIIRQYSFKTTVPEWVVSCQRFSVWAEMI